MGIFRVKKAKQIMYSKCCDNMTEVAKLLLGLRAAGLNSVR